MCFLASCVVGRSVRQHANCFLLCVLVTFLSVLWYTTWYNSYAWWTELHTLQRNIRLLKLMKNFPEQRRFNYSDFQLDVAASNALPLDRVIPDTRPPGCHDLTYDVTSLPKAAIIIPFYNEAWSMLLRTLHSIVDRTPDSLIEEIILVDDRSNHDHLQQPLQEYVTAMSGKIRVIRNQQREGLIRARLLAAREARAEVLVFLDAHVECNQDWLPPLLDLIQRNRSVVAVPHIDQILPETIRYKPWVGEVYGSFMWTMDYIWKYLPKDVIQTRKDTDPIRTATTIGCAMAINRDYFFHVGAFDEDMYVWGGENLEISFRIWMCGGSLAIVPCSRVGHMFRKLLPYSFPQKYGGRYIKYKNYQRVADVWFGEKYEKYYYATVRGRVPFTEGDLASLQNRRTLRDNLKCRDFSWYLENVAPDVTLPSDDAVFHGQLRNLGGGRCASALTLGGEAYLPLTDCRTISPDQMFTLDKDHMISHHGNNGSRRLCLTGRRGVVVTLDPCITTSVEQKWSFLPDHLGNVSKLLSLHERYWEWGGLSVSSNGSIYCLTQVSVGDGQYLGLMPCDSSGRDSRMTAYQLWAFNLHLDYEFAKEAIKNKTNVKRRT